MMLKYRKQEVRTVTIGQGITAIPDSLAEKMSREIDFAGSEKWVTGRIYGGVTVQVYDPEHFGGDAVYRYALEKKIVDGKTYRRIWFSRLLDGEYGDEDLTPIEEVVKKVLRWVHACEEAQREWLSCCNAKEV